MREAQRLLLRGGTVLSMDPKVGDLTQGDVLIEDGAIRKVASHIEADAETIDCAGRVVIPGFVNPHQHMFGTALRSYWSDALSVDYFTQSRAGKNAIYHCFTPEDVWWGELAGALECISAGTTSVVDTSQCSYTPDHTDAALDALKKSGVRSVFAFSPTTGGNVPAESYAHPYDIRRIMHAGNSLVSLGLGFFVNREEFTLARELGIPMFAHVYEFNGKQLEELENDNLLSPAATYIHCNELATSTWDAIARSGGKVTVSCIVEQTLGTGRVALQTALDRHLVVGLSTDGVMLGPADSFSQMKAAYALQRGRIAERRFNGETELPPVLSTRDVLEMATIGGARAAHLDHLVGSLTPGKRADVVVLNARTLNVAPLTHVTGAIVQMMDTSNVETVIIDGRIVKSDGALMRDDVQTVTDALGRSAEALLERSGYPDVFLTSCR